MKPIISPLKPNDHSADVVNLQDALLLLIDRGIIQLSADEHQSFNDQLSREQQDQAYQAAPQKRSASSKSSTIGTQQAWWMRQQRMPSIKPERTEAFYTGVAN